MTNEKFNPYDPDQHPGGLIGAIIQQSLDNAHDSGQSLIEIYREDAEKAQATLTAIREQIEDALESPYMPTPNHLISLLYPSPTTVQKYRDQIARGNL